MDYLAENASLVQELSQDCAFDCAFAADQNQCLIDCLSQQLALSEDCLQCNSNQIQCVLGNCALACLFPNSEACQNCIESNCLPPYFTCIGDEDQDGYTEAGGDCNTQDAAVYPGAPDEEGDGTDQNCDGGDGMVGMEEWTASLPFTLARQGEWYCVQWKEPKGTVMLYRADGRLLLRTEGTKGEECTRIPQGEILFWKYCNGQKQKRGKVLE